MTASLVKLIVFLKLFVLFYYKLFYIEKTRKITTHKRKTY